MRVRLRVLRVLTSTLIRICGGGWNDPLQPDHVKIRAAQIGIEYEKPRLAVTAVVEDRRFAALLDQRLQRIRESKLIEAQPINEGCIEKVEEGSKLVTDLTLAPAIPDRRFRRRA